MATLFGPKRIKARAIDRDQIHADFHQGARLSRRISDAVYMAAADQMSKLNNPLATQEPSIHGPRQEVADAHDDTAGRAMTVTTDPVAIAPILWLLGKTGAGKSSLIRALTGASAAEVGSGFVPCTRTSQVYDFPADTPLLRFLDTRGLGEAGYDPAEDLAACAGRSHAILALARLDDPVQGEVAQALARVLRRDPDRAVILVMTGPDLIDGAAASARAVAATQATFDRALGRAVPSVVISLAPDAPADATFPLIDALADVLPQVTFLLTQDAALDVARGDEHARFADIRPRVLFYAGVAATSDLAPVIGAVGVPAVQIAMLRELGRSYDVDWSRRTSGAFLGALGAGVAARYAALFGLRQIGKLIPVVGQTAVAAASGTVSFAATYALGRAAAYFLHHSQRGQTVSRDGLRAIYRDALTGARRGKA